MFIGEYQHTIDIKKRLSLPFKFRRELGKKVIITKGFDGCLAVYTKEGWKKVMEELKKLSTTKSEGRKLNRSFLGGAAEVTLDKLGRILLPDPLKEYAGLNKNVTICGLLNKLEIWDSEKWKVYRGKAEAEMDSIAENLPELGI